MDFGTLIRELSGGMLISIEIFVLTLVFSLLVAVVMEALEKKLNYYR